MTRPTDLAVDAIACYRLTRLATKDVLTQRLRDGIIRSAYLRTDRHAHLFTPPASIYGGLNPTTPPSIAASLGDDGPGAWQRWTDDDPHPPKLATLITCRWCAGMWIAFLVVTLRIFAPRPWNWVARALVAASAAALLARLEDD